MRRGEVWWAHVPMKGSGDKRRPMLIVSDDAFNANEEYAKVMAVHMTTVKRLAGPYSWEVTIPRGTAGLDRSSIVKCNEVYTLWKRQIQGQVGTVSRAVMSRVNQALAISLSLRLAEDALAD